MIKLSKDEIIDTLEKCLLNVECPCEQAGCCLADQHDCREQLFDNVVALLKEQEEQPKIIMNVKASGSGTVIGRCDRLVINH